MGFDSVSEYVQHFCFTNFHHPKPKYGATSSSSEKSEQIQANRCVYIYALQIHNPLCSLHFLAHIRNYRIAFSTMWKWTNQRRNWAVKMKSPSFRVVFYEVQASTRAHTHEHLQTHPSRYQMIRANHFQQANFPMDFQFPFWHSQIYARNEFSQKRKSIHNEKNTRYKLNVSISFSLRRKCCKRFVNWNSILFLMRIK